MSLLLFEKLLCEKIKGIVIIEKLDLDDKNNTFDCLRVSLMHKDTKNAISIMTSNNYEPVVADNNQGGYSVKFRNMESKVPITLFQIMGQKKCLKKKVRFMVEGIKKDFTSSFREISETFADILFDQESKESVSLTSSVRSGVNKTIIGVITFRIKLIQQQQQHGSIVTSEQQIPASLAASNPSNTISAAHIISSPGAQIPDTQGSLHPDHPATATTNEAHGPMQADSKVINNNNMDGEIAKQVETQKTKLEALRLESQALETQIDDFSKKTHALNESVKNLTEKAFPFLWECDEDHNECMDARCAIKFTVYHRRFVLLLILEYLMPLFIYDE